MQLIVCNFPMQLNDPRQEGIITRGLMVANNVVLVNIPVHFAYSQFFATPAHSKGVGSIVFIAAHKYLMHPQTTQHNT